MEALVLVGLSSAIEVMALRFDQGWRGADNDAMLHQGDVR